MNSIREQTSLEEYIQFEKENPVVEVYTAPDDEVEVAYSVANMSRCRRSRRSIQYQRDWLMNNGVVGIRHYADGTLGPVW